MLTSVVNSFEEWRTQAKACLWNEVQPAAVVWQSGAQWQTNLLSTVDEPATVVKREQTISIPKAFFILAQRIACHHDINKWDMLYQALWRITHGEKYLLKISSDVLVHKLLLMEKAVRRDMHKMKAFVRFKSVTSQQEDFYVAWYKPDHNILRLTAPFFQRRFAVMKWTIMTPDLTATWDGEQLKFSAGIPANTVIEDQIEDLWRTYYEAIFNPARIKIKAMKNEMPIRFWHNLPEAAIIPRILDQAPTRVAKMLREQEGTAVSAEEFLPKDITSISALRKAADTCKGCPLYKCARQTVFGEGSVKAKLMIVGEQPGLQEDIAGEPFVGPAGKMLRKVLDEVKLSEKEIYITNAVKHFKNEIIKQRQIHRTPNLFEINACKPWLKAEIELVKPKVILCLGVTAAKALIGPGFNMTRQHGKWEAYSPSQKISGTHHPAAIIRAPDPNMKTLLLKAFQKDLAHATELAYPSQFDGFVMTNP